MNRCAARAVPLALAVLTLLGGCTRGPSPAPSPAPRPSSVAAPTAPAAGDCWTTTKPAVRDVVGAPGALRSGSCDTYHGFETVLVGKLTGAPATGSKPPAVGDLGDAYRQCDLAAREYLAGAWQDAAVHLFVQPPTGDEWRAGARWFRCDLGMLRTHGGNLEPLGHALRAGLAAKAAHSVALTCGVGVDFPAAWTDVTPKDCTEPHDSEYAGAVAVADAIFPADAGAADRMFLAACRQRVRAFTGMSQRTVDRARARVGYLLTSGADEWRAGSRSARCYLGTDALVARSLRSVGDTTSW